MEKVVTIAGRFDVLEYTRSIAIANKIICTVLHVIVCSNKMVGLRRICPF